MKLPKDLRYTESHEWVRRESRRHRERRHHRPRAGAAGRHRLRRGAAGRAARSRAGEAVGVVESVKAASDIYAPVAGEVVAANAELAGAPEKVNEDAFAAWMFRIKPANAADARQAARRRRLREIRLA